MDPLTMALIAAGGQAIGALPDIIPSQYEREQKKELDALKKRQEQDLLGLTQQERDLISKQLQTKTQSQFDSAQAQRNRLLAGGMGVGGGDKLLADAALSEAQGKVAADAATQLEAINMQKKQQEEQFIRDLQAAQGEYDRARKDAIASIPAAGTAAYIGGMQPEALLKRGGIEGAKMAAELQALQLIQQEFGLTQAQARTQLDYLKQNNPRMYQFYTNPEMQTYMSMMGGSQ